MIEIAKYQEVNNSFKRRSLVFHMGCDSGFYSELNNMILGMIYCLQSGIRFSMYTADANFGYRDGWRDYFLPFCDEVKDSFHHRFNTRSEDPWFQMHGVDRCRYLLWRLRNKSTFLTFDVFCKFRQVSFERYPFSILQLELEGDLRHVARQIIDMVYRFNEQTTDEISKLITPLNLPENYIGLHIRRGDKFVEHPPEQCALYIEKASQLSNLKDFFVWTDDYNVVATLRRDYPDCNFYTLTTSEERGFFYSEFQNQDKVRKKKDMIKLFASMELLRKSDLFVGTFSSNPGMFLGMCMDRERVYGIDYEQWLLW